MRKSLDIGSQGLLGKFKAIEEKKVYNLCLFRTVFMEKYRKFLFQIKIAYGPLTCPELDPGSCMHE